MPSKNLKISLTAAAGAALAASLAAAPVAGAAENPFAITPITHRVNTIAAQEGNCSGKQSSSSDSGKTQGSKGKTSTEGQCGASM